MDDDLSLVAAAAAGSERAGEELFARHWVAAWRLALSVTGSSAAADDIAQDIIDPQTGNVLAEETVLTKTVDWIDGDPGEVTGSITILEQDWVNSLERRPGERR